MKAFEPRRIHRWAIATAMICVLSLAAGEAVQTPKSPAATAAIAKHTKAIADADAACKLAKLQANKALIDELKKAQADVLKAGGPASLDEANAIKTLIDKTIGEITGVPADLHAWVIDTKTFTYQISGKDARKFELLADGSIVGAGGPWEKKWRAEGSTIFISGSIGEEPFTRATDGSFRGKWTSGGKTTPAMIAPVK